MDIRILNKEFQWEYTIDSYKSFIWTERYQECGDFEIYLPMRSELLDYLKLDYYVEIDGSDYMMIIEELKTTTDPDDGDMLIVSGRDLSSILMRRVYTDTNTFSNLKPWAIFLAVWRASINIVNGKGSVLDYRRLMNLYIYFKHNTANDPLSEIKKCTLEIVYDIAVAFAKETSCGFRMIYYESGGNYPDVGPHVEFQNYDGVDRSYNQTENPYVIFSDDFGNLLGAEFTVSKKDFGNVACVGSESPWNSENKTTYYVSNISLGEYGSLNTITGMNRYEIPVNVSGVLPETNVYSANAETIYRKAMQSEGKLQLGRHKLKEDFTGTGEDTPQWIYKKDYFLGDIVQVEDKYGNSAPARITEYIYCDDNSNGEQKYPTFSVI